VFLAASCLSAEQRQILASMSRVTPVMNFTWAGNTIDQVNVFPGSNKAPRKHDKLNDPDRLQALTGKGAKGFPKPIAGGAAAPVWDDGWDSQSTNDL